MNTLDKFRAKQQTLELLDKSFNTKQNVIKINRNNTFRHEIAKCMLAIEARSQGYDIVTEAIFKNGKRADILVLQQQEAWEVLESESKKSFMKKEKDYPVIVLPFKADYVIKRWIDKMELIK